MKISAHRILQTTIISFLVLVAFFSHGTNMLRFPYYENDEGVYMSQAWSLITQGRLAPYTYWYDHAPMGWFTIALWTKLTGGFYTFGQSVNTGRVFMLILQIINTGFVFFIAKRITKHTFPALLAAIVFAISPLGIYFHRRILLDNIMTTFVLASYAVLLVKNLTLLTIFTSGLLLALGVLSKENAIFFIPGLLATIAIRTKQARRPIAMISWITIIGSIVSMYLLYAMLKGEFFASGTFLGGDKPHVSLLTTLAYQTSRKGGGFFDSGTWSSGSNFRLWINQDPLLTIGGVIGLVIITSRLIFFGIRRKLKTTGLLTGLVVASLGFFYFLGRGGIVIEFYIVPLLPFLALLIGVGYGVIPKSKKTAPFLGLLVIVGFAYIYHPYIFTSRSFPQQSGGKNLYTTDQTKSQRDALAWIRENVKEDEALIFDNYAYLDLKDPKNPGKKVYKNSHWYWKVDLDPEIRDGVYQNTAELIDYVAMTPQMNADLGTGVSPLTQQALFSAHMVKALDLNGWSVNIFRSTFPKQILARSWEWYKNAFIDNGRIVDHSQKEITTSEGQSYALLRAVWMDDQTTFDSVWQWTQEHLSLPGKLFAWRWDPANGIQGEGNQGTAPDANTSIALALLFASKQWNNDTYKAQAVALVRAIWDQEIGYLNSRPYLAAGNWAIRSNEIIINPSYLTPYAFRIFAEVTPDLAWNAVVDSSYEILTACTTANLNTASSVFLPPEWCMVKADGSVHLPTDPGISSSDYSYNAFRVPFHLALDYQWNQDSRAKEYLSKMNFLFTEWKEKNKLVAIYSHDGQPKADYEAVPAYAGSLGAFLFINPTGVSSYYNQKLRGRFYEIDGKSFWDDPTNYYTQNWGWFGTGLYSQQLPNLWEK